MTVIAFHIVGMPGPMGSKISYGKHGMAESSKLVKPWRQAVVAAALPHRPAVPLDGPLRLRLAFTLPRPKSAAKTRWAPDRKPDLSKLVRSTEDALTDAAIWADDARVVECGSSKHWWPDHGALPMSGALVMVVDEDGPPPSFDWERALWEAVAALQPEAIK